MMVETILESSQDFGMSNGALPQWKRELLQRRAARARPPMAPSAPVTPPPAPPADEDEELRYGPGIVKRLKSRYLSLALREAPRRRPSVLRRAASLEHLLDERPPPAPRPRPARPVSLAAPSYAALSAPPPRRDSVKRARSVDALSRLDSRDDTPPHVPLQPPPQPPPPPPSPPPPLPRSARPPRRPTPLLRETERPPADVVRSTLRKFESAPPRRTAPAARVSAVLRGLEALPRSSTPEPRGRSPSPAAADLSAIDEPEGVAVSVPCETKPVSQAALEGIARAGSSVRYSFEAPKRGSHLPPVAATNPVMLGRARLSASPRRVGVIRPMPAPTLDRSVSSPTPAPDDTDEKDDAQRIASPLPYDDENLTKKDSPPSALVEPIIRSTPDESAPISSQTNSTTVASVIRELTPEPEPKPQQKPPPQIDAPKIGPPAKPLVNGHATPPKPVEAKTKGALSRIGAAGIERAWTGADEKKSSVVAKEKKDNGEAKSGPAPWAPASTSVVFNFSNRKEVPDYIENDGIILRANRRNRFKAGEAGIVVLRPEALAADSESEEEDTRPPSPCSVRFVNDNVLINGRSSMAAKICRDRAAKLKLQFDDSLTRTFEYPSETSLCEDSPSPTALTNANNNTPTPTDINANANASASANHNGDALQQIAQPAHLAPLSANTHIVSASLSRYTPSKTSADAFQLGLARRPDAHDAERAAAEGAAEAAAAAEAEAEAEAGDARPCGADSARSWSEARTHATDLLF
ncbi:serine/arginine repetitive matrix protein 1-like [Vanessa cardui]|uniref:serine/arginine repetitive matrix protein 1-like n=1 Tax=Vanessa cardui TaxID=171605 RepID=UPI001F13DB08|nr:serine/arginine repetitive matrix protein 1-like [Vanessa cardui]